MSTYSAAFRRYLYRSIIKIINWNVQVLLVLVRITKIRLRDNWAIAHMLAKHNIILSLRQTINKLMNVPSFRWMYCFVRHKKRMCSAPRFKLCKQEVLRVLPKAFYSSIFLHFCLFCPQNECIYLTLLWSSWMTAHNLFGH